MNTDKTFAQAVAAEIRGEARAQGLTLDDMAALSGVTKVSVQRYLAGTRELPVSTLYSLTAALRVDPADLMAAAVRRMERTEDEKPQRDRDAG